MTREMDAENEYEKAVAAPLHVNVKTAPNRRQFLRLDNIRSSMIVGDLKKEILAKVGLDSQTTLAILHGQRCLDDNMSLELLDSSYRMVHAVKLETPPMTPAAPRQLSATEQQQLVAQFRAAATDPQFRQTLQEASTRRGVARLSAEVAGLADDPVAVSMLSDWELLLHVADAKRVATLVQRHPALALAAARIAASFQPTVGVAGGDAQRRGWAARAIGADVDEDPQQPAPAADVLTSARFAAALASVNQSLAAAASPVRPAAAAAAAAAGASSSSTPAPAGPSGTALTQAMVTQALLQAMSSVATSGSSSGGSTRGHGSSSRQRRSGSGAGEAEASAEEPLRRQFGRLLPQMRELGIADDTLSLRALQATDGDVQAAVNLVFAGLIDD